MKSTLTLSFLEIVAYGQIWYGLLFVSRVVPGTEVRLFGGFLPSSAYLPSSPCIGFCLLLLCIIPSASPGIFPVQNWQEEKCLLCPPFLLVLVHLFGEPLWWQQKLLNLKSQDHKTSFYVQHYFVVFFLSFSWVSCCLFNWWANSHYQSSLPTFIFMCQSQGEDWFYFTCLIT